MGQKVGEAVPWLPVLIWTVINWKVITNPNLITNNNNNNNTNSKPNTNPNPKSNPNKNPNPNRSPNQVLTVQISTIQISPGNFTVQILTVQIPYGYRFILPLFRSHFVTNNTKFAPTLYWIIIRLLCVTHLNKILFDVNICSLQKLRTYRVQNTTQK